MNERIIVGGVNREMTDAEQAITDANRQNPRIQVITDRQQEINQWFTQNDWKVNKIALQEWLEDNPKAIEYQAERLAIRTEQDALSEELLDLV